MDSGTQAQQSKTADVKQSRRRSLRSTLSVTNIGGVYVLLAIIVFFGLLEPDKFLTEQTAKTVLNQYSVTGLIALSLVVPLAAGIFDLSVAATAGFSSMLVAVLLTQTSMPMEIAILLTLASGVVIGLANAIVVVWFRIDSFIGTLATGAILGALTIAVSGNETITGGRVSTGFADDIALRNFEGITIVVGYLLVVTLIIGFALEQTKTGRYWYAIGFDSDASKLAGVRVNALRAASLVIPATVASVAGVVLTARTGGGAPGAGAPYLLPAFAAAFLGATQFRRGRFNVWGTVLAVFLVGTGQYGLALSSAPVWAPDVFIGVVLIVAVGIAGYERRTVGSRKLRFWQRPGDTTVSTTEIGPGPPNHAEQ